jgi:hypothetical protein
MILEEAIMSNAETWAFLPVGYVISILIETPILLVGLSARHPLGRRLAAGFWLTACTYPIVILVLPAWLDPATSSGAYLGVAEMFAPIAECALFWAAFGTRDQFGRPSMWRDLMAITLANLASFAVGELLYACGWLAGQ